MQVGKTNVEDEEYPQNESIFKWLKTTKIQPQNTVIKLFHRELHLYPKKHLYSTRTWYHNVTPNFTVNNVHKPPCFLRKFSPDGRCIIAFSADQTALEIYSYNGPAAAEDLLQYIKDDGVLTDEVRRSDIEKCIFDRFFTLRHTVNVAQNREQLNRECSLFTNDGKYVIIGSASMRNVADLDDTYRNNESVTPNPRSPLDDYNLYIINLDSGTLEDLVLFPHDKIFLAHNQGLSLYENTLAILSVQHQSIHIFQITPSGQFSRVRIIGRICFDDDDFVLQREAAPNNPNHHFYQEGKKMIYSLKHKLLAFLFRLAKRLSDTDASPKHLLEFYKNFEFYYNLKVWKMQLLDSAHLLLKYASEEVVTLRAAEPNSQPSIFVVYNMDKGEVLMVYQNNSTDFLATFENFADYFRNARLDCESPYTSSPSNNYWARLIHERHKATIVSARGGGVQEATKRLLGQVPVSSQSFSASPYLDLDLFSYDDKWVSVMERPKNCADLPIKFFARDSGLLKFSLHAERSLRANLTTTMRRLVAFTFHPTDPFTISVQRANDEYVVSFHIRHTQNR